MFSSRTCWNLSENALARALDAYRRAGRRFLDLTVSNPTQAGLRYDEAAILQALAHPASLTYRPEPKGLSVAREAVAEYYLSDHQRGSGLADASSGGSVSLADSILLTVSTSEAYSFVFRLLCDPGDEILAPTPSYPLFEFLAGLQDVRLVPYLLQYDHGWQLDFHSLQSALTPRTRAILLVHPNNPTGSYIKQGERERLNRICTERGLALVVDEVFLDYPVLDHSASSAGGPCVRSAAEHTWGFSVRQEHPQAPQGILDRPSPTFACNREALTFTLSGISKISGLPQMKLAWLVVSGPPDLAAAARSRLEVIADTYLSMNAPVQLAAPALLAQRSGIGDQLRRRVRANLAELDRQLARQTLCTRLEVEGGWYAILRVPATRSDEELAILLLENHGVLVQPGYFYDFHCDGYLVVSLITPEEQFREGVARLWCCAW